MGSAEYDTIAAIKQAVQIPVIANGDVTTPEKARFVLDYTGVDGLMVGRAAQGRPWIFQEIYHYLTTGNQLPCKSIPEALNVIESHLEKIYDLYGDFKGVLFARKHVSSYMKNLPGILGVQLFGSQQFKQSFNQCSAPKEQLSKLQNYFELLSNNNNREIAA